jgi:hypothetical protein
MNSEHLSGMNKDHLSGMYVPLGEPGGELAGGTEGGHHLVPAYKNNSKNPISKA